MSLEEITKTLHARIEKQDYKGKIVSVEHVRELQEDIEGKHRQDLLSEEVYREVMTWVDFRIPEISPSAKSIIIVAVPQPQIRLTFNRNGNSLHCLIPCQKICPVDKDFLNMIEEGPTFSHEETASILQGEPIKKIPKETIAKLEELSLAEYLDILGRNLGVLFQR